MKVSQHLSFLKHSHPDNNSIACNILNMTGTEKTLIMIFDEKGNDIGRIPNRDITKEDKLSISIGYFKFFHYGDNLLYSQTYNDTIFSVLANKSKPYLILKRGKISTFEKEFQRKHY